MPELTIYRQTDLESALSSALAEQQAADPTPEPATTTEDGHLLPSFFRRLSNLWKKGPLSAITATMSGHPIRQPEGPQEAAASTTGSGVIAPPAPAVLPPRGTGSQGTPDSAEPPATSTTPDSTQSYRVDHLPNGAPGFIYRASGSKLSYPIRVVDLPPGAILGRDTADVAPAFQAPTGNGNESQVGQKTWWKMLQVAFGPSGLGT